MGAQQPLPNPLACHRLQYITSKTMVNVALQEHEPHAALTSKNWPTTTERSMPLYTMVRVDSEQV